MKRAGIAALWLGTIAVTWVVVRAAADERVTERAVVEPPAPRSAYVPRSARRVAPTPATERAEPVTDDPGYRQALAALERDMADGRWSVDDRDRLTVSMAQIGGRQSFELLSTVLFPKLNSGVLKTEIDGPPI